MPILLKKLMPTYTLYILSVCVYRYSNRVDQAPNLAIICIAADAYESVSRTLLVATYIVWNRSRSIYVLSHDDGAVMGTFSPVVTRLSWHHRWDMHRCTMSWMKSSKLRSTYQLFLFKLKIMQSWRWHRFMFYIWVMQAARVMRRVIFPWYLFSCLSGKSYLMKYDNMWLTVTVLPVTVLYLVDGVVKTAPRNTRLILWLAFISSYGLLFAFLEHLTHQRTGKKKRERCLR